MVTTPTTLMPYEIRALERAAYTLYLSMDAWRYMAVARTMREHHLKSFRVSVRALLHAVDVFALKLLFRFHFFPFLPLSAPVFASFILFYIFFFFFPLWPCERVCECWWAWLSAAIVSKMVFRRRRLSSVRGDCRLIVQMAIWPMSAAHSTQTRCTSKRGRVEIRAKKKKLYK